ncbi:alpha/beta hydrolase [Bergeriella denitrificans]|uniref:Predicted esterase of the alpha/beta hydrolase fold n=1 Tax=Bergeriella denitrificans TaxID=494 RepID=A0A378UIC5_BERDE|nr:alpha/beta hydrolase [Bergeriella denitrificans]STZ76910.1 Predicted esterase of the alpha/beta hydrolase fold [Bergeriella denitrificans]
MQTHELEDLTLLLIRDADEAEMWIDRWAVSYPTVCTAEAAAQQSIADWQRTIQTAFGSIVGRHIAVAAHGAGAAAFLAWLYQADAGTLRRIGNIILVEPPTALPDDAEHTLLRARCPCRAALVIGSGDETLRLWAEDKARLWHTRLLTAPQPAPLSSVSGGWQWGMKLMQEMLLS